MSDERNGSRAQSPLLTPGTPEPARSRTLTSRARAFVVANTQSAPVLQEHLLSVVESSSRLVNSKRFWLCVGLLLVFVVQAGMTSLASGNQGVLRRPAKRQTGGLEDGIEEAFRQWEVLQERYPSKFQNFSQYLVDSKRYEKELKKQILDLNERSVSLLNNIVVPPAGKRPVYTKDEQYELTWTYLLEEKAWPYVGSERYLEFYTQFAVDNMAGNADKKLAVVPFSSSQELARRYYYNSLAVFPHNNRTRLHGLAGINSNGTRYWQVSPQPPPIAEAPEGQEEALKNGGFYLKLSNALPLDRDVPDLRPDECRKEHSLRFYSPEKIHELQLEDVSIVITFYNEHASTLFRSVHSVLNQTPPPLLREIILVDDHSNSTDVIAGGPLDQYVKLLPKTKVLRLPERRGLVQARLAGAKIAKAPIIIVLDSHIEVNVGWLEPLVYRLKQSPKSVVFPQIMSLDPETFVHRIDSGIGCFLSFKWMMQERPYFQPPKSGDGEKAVAPVASPSMAGGLFGVRRDWFFDLGGYDEEFKMWGAENVEMGFRYWMCGGRVECMPCSYTYHIYRKGGSGYKSPGEFIAKNRIRTAMLWTDKYYQLARHFLDTSELGRAKAGVDVGSFEKMKELKRKFECKDFSWYLKNVDPNRDGSSATDYGLIGEMKAFDSGRCIDTMQQKNGGKPVGHYGCHGQKGSQGWFELKPKHQIRSMSMETMCIGKDLKLTHCDQKDNDDMWKTIPDKKWIVAAKTKSALKSTNYEADYECLGWEDNKREVLKLRPCDPKDNLVKWEYKLFVWDPNYRGPLEEEAEQPSTQ